MLEARLQHARGTAAHTDPDPATILCFALAAGVSPQCFDYLLRICVLKKDASKLEPVMKLPCMQQLSSTQLCSSIYRAGKAGCKTLAQQLCRWVRVLF